MKDKSRNRTWGRVLTPRPIIILFETTADSSDLITWQACTATQTQTWHLNTHTRKMTRLHRQTPSPVTAPKTKRCTRPLALSVSVTLSPLHSDVKPNEQDSEADIAPGCTPCILPLPIYSTCFSLIVFLSGCPSPLSYCIQKINHNPLKGCSMKKKNQGGDSRSDTLKHIGALSPTYDLCF